MKIKLINPGVNNDLQSSIRNGVYPPLNLAVLSAYLKKHNPMLEVHITDCESEKYDIKEDNNNYDVVGISCNFFNYKNAIDIARTYHEKGSRIVLGGPYPSINPDRILMNNYFVDAIICFDGEQSLFQYVNGDNYSTIPNLIYRSKDQIIHNKIIKTNIEEFLIPDYGNLELEDYFKKFQHVYGKYKPFKSSLAIYSRKGCKWRDISDGGCIFCMIPHSGVQSKRCMNIWKEIKTLKNLYNVDLFWDVSDNFIEDSNWLDELVRTKPDNINFALQIYARPSNLNKDIVKKLKEINVYEVFIGAESGDNKILYNARKGLRVDQTMHALDLLAESGISAVVSFVLGLPGENPESLIKTINMANRISKYENVMESSVGIMLPIPGGNAFNDLLRFPNMVKKYNTDYIKIDELKRDWINNFTFVNLKELETAMQDILCLYRINNEFSTKICEGIPNC